MVEFDLQKSFLIKNRTHDFRTKLVSMRGYPRHHSDDEVHQGVHDVFARLETRVGYVYKRRKEDVEQEGCEYAPLAKALFHSVPTASNTSLYIKNWFMMKSEKAAPVTGTALRTTAPVPVDSQH